MSTARRLSAAVCVCAMAGGLAACNGSDSFSDADSKGNSPRTVTETAQPQSAPTESSPY